MMAQETKIVGIDVGLRRLEVRILGEPKSWSVPNDPKGWKRLVQLWSGRPVMVGIEPSGGYEMGVVTALSAAGVDVRWAEPKRVRALATALGAPAKTDPIDTEMIARYIEATGGRPVSIDPQRQALRELLAARRAALETADRLQAQARMLSPGQPKAALERLADQADAEAAALTIQLTQALANNPQLSGSWRLLQTAPGVGPLVAAELLAEMPELGRVSEKAIAKLAGLAPFTRQSGAWVGRATCSGGRPKPRRALYLAAMASLRARQGLRPVYEHLIAKGKPRMVALVACMRRLLVALNAMLAQQTPWRTTTP